MKLSKLFHTLYATVMALPVLVIPIFALNILHKETEPISITTSGYEYTPKFQTSDIINDPQSLTNGYIYTFKLNQYFYDEFLSNYGNELYCSYVNFTNSDYDSEITFSNEDNLLLISYEVAFRRFIISDDTDVPILEYGNSDDEVHIVSETWDVYQQGIEYGEFYKSQTSSDNIPIEYIYNEGIVYNNTDIGSQFVYALYKPVHDYFNFGDFFGLGGMYDWFTLNIFNGTAPLSFFIVFNVMIYWLFISLFWLLFDILIYVPMVIHKWLDKAEM